MLGLLQTCESHGLNNELQYVLNSLSLSLTDTTPTATAYPETKPYSVTVGDTYAPSTCRNEIFTPNPVMTFTPPVIEKCPVAFGIKTEFSGNGIVISRASPLFHT